MPISSEMRRLEAKFRAQTGWPKWLEWLEIDGIRGWTGQRFSCSFPIMAIVGENGVGKSSILQCAAAIYKGRKKERFASDFFPDTAWEQVTKASIRYAIREGDRAISDSIRKPTSRWRGNFERRERHVEYIDLSRIQPVPARVGYSRLAKSNCREVSADAFDATRVASLSQVMGRSYERARMSLTDADRKRSVPVLGFGGAQFSGFHQGAGETTVTELLQADFPQTGLVLIDEIESSLHPRSQRRLIRHLAQLCRERELQVILTTHSTAVLDELPLEARACVLLAGEGRSIVYGTSPEFAMSKMDDVPHTECDLYVEDPRARTMLTEILTVADRDLVQRCQVIAYGAGSVGKALGQMTAERRFPRATCVFLDGDQGTSRGCANLPGEDAPERVVFSALKALDWPRLDARLGRPFASVADACNQAMTFTDHHEWLNHAATPLVLATETLWQVMCAEWARTALDQDVAARIARTVRDALEGIAPNLEATPPSTVSLAPPPPQRARPPKATADPNGLGPLFGQSQTAVPQ